LAQLIVVEGASRGKTFDLADGLVIGSGEEADLRVDDRRASPRQLQVRVRDSVIEIRNLDVRHNVLVNGEVVRRWRRLNHGDWVSVADTTFVFSDEVPRERKAVELSLGADDLLASRITARRALFDSAESVLESIDDGSGDPRESVRSHLATLYRVSSAISCELHLPKLLDRILDICFEVFAVERGFVLLLDKDDRKLKCVASRGSHGERDVHPDISKTIVREVFARQEALLSIDASNDARFLEGQSLFGSGIKSVMCAPLVSEGRVTGVVQLDTTSQAQRFRDADLELLSAIAMQCAIAIENARAYKRRQEYSRSLIYLARATQNLSSFLSRDRIYREAVKSACSLLGATKGSLLLRHAPDGPLQLVYSVGMGRELAQQVSASPEHEIAARVIDSGEPLLVPDVRQFELSTGIAVREGERYASRSFLIVPVFAASEFLAERGKAMGALCVTDKLSHGAYSGNDREVLQILASQTGIALANAELYEKATIDPLTGLYVRRHFFQRLEVATKNAHFAKKALSLIMIDLDHFKSVNDTYGHTAGDAVLRRFGKLLRRVVRQDMTCARYGGEEFAVICPGVGEGVAVQVAERVRAAIERQAFRIPDGPSLHKTASLGVAILCPGESEHQLLVRTDQALYRAKNEGRNRVVSAGPPDATVPRPIPNRIATPAPKE